MAILVIGISAAGVAMAVSCGGGRDSGVGMGIVANGARPAPPTMGIAAHEARIQAWKWSMASGR